MLADPINDPLAAIEEVVIYDNPNKSGMYSLGIFAIDARAMSEIEIEFIKTAFETVKDKFHGLINLGVAGNGDATDPVNHGKFAKVILRIYRRKTIPIIHIRKKNP
jgi:hypothetical protein